MTEPIEMKRDSQGVYRPVSKKAGNQGRAVQRTAPASLTDEAINALGPIVAKHAELFVRRLISGQQP